MYIKKKRGDIVEVEFSVWSVFKAALGLRDTYMTSNRSYRTHGSSFNTNAEQGGRKQRPAIVLERIDRKGGPPAYWVTPLTSMCGTPYNCLNANAKDLLLPLVGLSMQQLPHGTPSIHTTPEWDKRHQYVVTFAVQTSDIREWSSNIRVSEENLQLLEKVGEQQSLALMKKISNYKGAAEAWLSDVFFPEARARKKIEFRARKSTPEPDHDF